MMDTADIPNQAASGDANSPEPAGRPNDAVSPRSAFWLFFWMGMASFICKLYYFLQLKWDGYEWDVLSMRYNKALKHLASATHEDLLFALVAGLIGQGLLWLTARWPRVERLLFVLMLLFCAFAVVYAVAATQIFWFFRSYLTVTWFKMAGGTSIPVRSYITPILAILLLLTPIVYLSITLVTHRTIQPRRTITFRIVQGSLLVLMLCWITWGFRLMPWFAARHDYRVADSPHHVLLTSWLRDWRMRPHVHDVDSIPDDYFNDFRTAGELPAGGKPTPGLSRGPKNVIVISLESVATRYLSLHGSRFKTTPRLEAEEKNALVFNNAYSHVTNSGNALMAMLLSNYPPMTWREHARTRPDMPGTSLPSILQKNGYRTAFISGCDNRFAHTDWFLANRGFDTIWDQRDAGCEWTSPSAMGVEDRCLIDMILRYIDQGKESSRPFFVFSWSQQTHWPYDPSPKQEKIEFITPQEEPKWGRMWWDIGRYLNTLVEMDRQIGRLFDELRKRGLADDTIVIITGDHGEGMGEPHDSIGHSGQVYQEDVNVPLIIWSPSLFKNQPRPATVTAHVDLSPTIADLLNVPAPANWQGKSVFNPIAPNRAYSFGAKTSYLLSLREGSLKYTLNTTHDSETLFDLAKDPNEQVNIAASHPADCARFRKRIAAWLTYQTKFYKDK